MTTEQINISADKVTVDNPNRDFSYYAVLSIKVLLLLAVLHISAICIIDIEGRYDGTTFDYPIIHPYFVWGIFFLPLVGIGLLFIKKLSYRLLGTFLIIVSVWDIYLFLQQTAGAL
jgi:hypothetical protein